MAQKYTCSQPQLKNNSWSLNDESFHTLMVEVEGIMNSRQLTLSDATSYKPLPPSDLLMMKSKVVLLLAGKFQKDLYTWKYWRRVPHLANEFWYQWRKEVLLSLQEQTWHFQKWNFGACGIVLLKVDAHWNNWSMAMIIHVYPIKDGIVQNVQLLVGSCNH